MHLSVALFQTFFYACQVVKLVSSTTLFKRQNTQWEINYKNDGSTASVKDDFIDVSSAYRLYANIWGAEQTTKESFQNIKAQSVNYGGTSMSWKTDYNWESDKNPKTKRAKVSSKNSKKKSKKRKKNKETQEDDSVKSYANVLLHLSPEYNPQLGQIQSMESSWKWDLKSESSSGELVSNVAYDFFTSDDQRCEGGNDSRCAQNEIMIWMHRTGDMRPVGDQYQKTYQSAGCEFDVYSGSHSSWPLYSLVAKHADGCKPTERFDVFQGIAWVALNFAIPTKQYLVSAYAGTQVVSGQGTFETTEYSIQINYKTF